MTRSERSSSFSQFLAEMKRRHVVRFAFGYAAAAFVILQLAEIVFPAFGIGEGGLRVLVVLTGLGFPPALVLAWVYDITTEGIKRTTDGGAPSPILSRMSLAALLIVTIGATGAVGIYLAERGVFDSAVNDRPATRSPVQRVAYDPSQPIRSLAVLPLDDFSPDASQAYFTSGMHEELIAKLSMLPGVRVVSRTTVMRYAGSELTSPEIGAELDVDVLIGGSVSRTLDPDRTRVRLEITHAASDDIIKSLEWDETDLTDVLAFQTEVAHEVVHEIESDHEESLFQRTALNIVPAAQDAYFRGKYEYEKGTADGYRTAIGYFEEAVAEAPEFAPAMAGLAGARFLVGLADPDLAEEELAQAREEAHLALSMDSTSMEALEVVDLIERSMPRIMSAAVTASTLPTAPKAVHVMTMAGDGDSIVVDLSAFDTAWITATTSLGERIEEQVRRVSFGPTGGRATLDARQLMSAGRYDEASDVLEAIVEGNPGSVQAWEMLARSRMASGNAVDASRVIERWHDSGVAGAPDEAWVLSLQEATEREGTRGYWEWTLDRLTAREADGEPVPRTELATAHAALGHADEAFGYLYQALEAGEPAILALRFDPVWDELRNDPRFRDIGRQAQQIRFSPAMRRPPRGGRGDGR
jgi:TolB-like protein